MNFYVIPEISIVVGWTEKCACTSVCDWLVNGIIRPNSPLEKKHREFLHQNNYLHPPKEALANIYEKGFTPVLFTRDPYSRIESAFLNKFVFRKGKPLKNEAMLEPFALKVANEVSRRNGYEGEYKGISIIELLTYVKDNLNDRKPVNGHWAPQHMNSKDRDLDLKSGLADLLNKKRYLVKQESFNHDLKNVNCGLGINYVPEYKNVTTAPAGWKPRHHMKADFGKMLSSEIIDRKIDVPKKKLMTPEVKALVEEIYIDDFKLFSYKLAN